jgi:hypothetical protein
LASRLLEDGSWGVGNICGYYVGSIRWLESIRGSKRKQRGFLMAIYAARGFSGTVSAYYGSVVAFSHVGPMLEYARKRAGASSLISVARWRMVEKAAVNVSKARVLLLLRVARFNLIGLALTAAELAYYGYVKFIADDAFQKWCLECTFRNQKKKMNVRTGQIYFTRYYVTEKEELEALAAAYKEITE